MHPNTASELASLHRRDLDREADRTTAAAIARSAGGHVPGRTIGNALWRVGDRARHGAAQVLTVVDRRLVNLIHRLEPVQVVATADGEA
ncbi:MAG TPA: hypothetical protein VNF73_03010 [Candidatus Saccharimonadales bacterium]|nr:hypothetical protein [Candidatus Saccharimonadales bacterium]